MCIYIYLLLFYFYFKESKPSASKKKSKPTNIIKKKCEPSVKQVSAKHKQSYDH